MLLTVIASLLVLLAPAPAGAAPSGGAVAVQAPSADDKRSKKSTRALPRAGSPAASQRYARAYISQRYNWGSGQFSCLKSLWTRESGWRYWVSNPNGRYHGIPQTSSREWSKDGYTTRQYMRSPEVQIKVGARYIKSRYGSPCGAWAHFRSHNWY